jgi:hypothetical protein
MSVIGAEIIDSVPYINGKKAVKSNKKPLLDCLSEWCCPECGANLAKDSLICLNACHLSAASSRRFHSLLAHCYAVVDARREQEKMKEVAP